MSQSSISLGAYSDTLTEGEPYSQYWCRNPVLALALILTLRRIGYVQFSGSCRNPVLALALILTKNAKEVIICHQNLSQSSISPGAYSDDSPPKLSPKMAKKRRNPVLALALILTEEYSELKKLDKICRNPVLALALILTLAHKHSTLTDKMSQSSISPGAYSDVK